jgi:hypothetical protein
MAGHGIRRLRAVVAAGCMGILLLAPGAAAAQPTQTCSTPSTCETDAEERARGLTALRKRGQDLERLYRPYEALDRHYRPTRVEPANPAGDGFDWGDAGVGAGAGLGLALGACALAIRRRGRVRGADAWDEVARVHWN